MHQTMNKTAKKMKTTLPWSLLVPVTTMIRQVGGCSLSCSIQYTENVCHFPRTWNEPDKPIINHGLQLPRQKGWLWGWQYLWVLQQMRQHLWSLWQEAQKIRRSSTFLWGLKTNFLFILQHFASFKNKDSSLVPSSSSRAVKSPEVNRQGCSVVSKDVHLFI